MLDRKVVKEFLEENFKDSEIEVPEDINLDELVETFCLYTENDYYEWLKDNYKSFFSIGTVGLAFNWDEIKKRIEERRKSGELKKEEIKLSNQQREKIEHCLAQNDIETTEWHKDRVLYDICMNGLVGFTNMSDEDLVDCYKDYVENQEIPEKDRII